jgi:hypothetical protein
MGIMKRLQMEQAEEEFARLDREFERNHPDLVAEGWDRELWEAFEWALEKDD